MIEATCQQCNKKFGTYSSLIARGKGKYCSIKCFAEYRDTKKEVECEHCKKKFIGRSDRDVRFCSKKCYNISLIKCSVERICLNCNKKFLIPQSNLVKSAGKYCSWECYKMHRSIDKKCLYCNKPFKVVFSNDRYKYCSKACYSKSQIKYTCGIKAFRRSRRTARKLVLKVFKPICVVCGKPEDHVHHKDCNAMNNNLSNLEFRCIPCHIDIHREIRERAG